MEKARSLIEAEESLDPSDAPGMHTPSGVVAAGTTSSRRLASEPAARLKSIESGVFSALAPPVSGEQLVESLQNALSAASRGEAGLGSLHRSVRDASRALTSSRQAHEALTEELRVLYRGLNEALSEKAAVERYAALLTQERDAALDAAEETRREAKRERDFLLREQDRFIQLLLEEHEAELAQVRRAVSRQQTQLAPPAGVAPIQPLRVRAVEGPDGPAPETELEERPRMPRLVSTSVARVQLHAGPPAESKGGQESLLETQRSEAPGPDDDHVRGERPPTYPPAPAVIDLADVAAEVDGNSERPPPIRRVGAEPKLQLKPARVPSLLDTLVSNTGNTEPSSPPPLPESEHSRKA